MLNIGSRVVVISNADKIRRFISLLPIDSSDVCETLVGRTPRRLVACEQSSSGRSGLRIDTRSIVVANRKPVYWTLVVCATCFSRSDHSMCLCACKAKIPGTSDSTECRRPIGVPMRASQEYTGSAHVCVGWG